MKTTIVVTDSNGLKCRQAPVVIKDNGALWAMRNFDEADSIPITLADRSLPKEELIKLVKSKQFNKIPDDCFARIGDIVKSTGGKIMLLEDYRAMREPIEIAERQKAKIKALRTLEVFLSTRGWGDFSNLYWVGDVDTDVSQIVKECRAKLKNGHDVDNVNQTDDEILKAIKKAKEDRLAKMDSDKEAYNEALQIIKNTGEDTKKTYLSCKGDADKLYDDIDHPLYWSVLKYSHAMQMKIIYEDRY